MSAAMPTSRDPRLNTNANEVTEILPFDGFAVDDLDALVDSEFDWTDVDAFDFRDFGASTFLSGQASDVGADDSPVAAESAIGIAQSALIQPTSTAMPLISARNVEGPDVSGVRRSARHRAEPASAARSRALLSAMAAGAAAAAFNTVLGGHDTIRVETVLASKALTVAGNTIGTAENDNHIPRGVQVIAVHPAANVATHNQELAKGLAFAEERAQREQRLQRPLFAMPTQGVLTSNFGYRWGVLHAGIDIANSIGTPIYAVADGVVTDAGPKSGYGMWVKLLHADGTETLYGHVNSTLVSVGERVLAGDQIATMGNRGNSTGPHLHFEVLTGGSERIDPQPWLAKRGLKVGNYDG